MENTYNVSLPAQLAFLLNMQEQEFSEEVKRLVLVRLFEMGKISSGKAAKMLGINRITFLEMLANYNVSMFNDSSIETVLNDWKNA